MSFVDNKDDILPKNCTLFKDDILCLGEMRGEDAPYSLLPVQSSTSLLSECPEPDKTKR